MARPMGWTAGSGIVGSNIVDAAGIGNAAYDIHKNWDKMTPAQRVQATGQLAFFGSLGIATTKASGGKVFDGFNVPKLKDQVLAASVKSKSSNEQTHDKQSNSEASNIPQQENIKHDHKHAEKQKDTNPVEGAGSNIPARQISAEDTIRTARERYDNTAAYEGAIPTYDRRGDRQTSGSLGGITEKSYKESNYDQHLNTEAPISNKQEGKNHDHRTTEGQTGKTEGAELAARQLSAEDAIRTARERYGVASAYQGTPPELNGRGIGQASGSLGGITEKVYKVRPEIAEIWSRGRISAPDFHELKAGNHDVFHQAIKEAKDSTPLSAAVALYDAKEYTGMRLFLTPDKSAGFALKGDDIVSVFRHAKSPYKGMTPALLDLAVSQGGRRLDAFDTVLPHLYGQSGFKVVSRTSFDPVHKPEGWDYKQFEQFDNGKPDVVFMVYDPDHKVPYQPKEGKTYPTYDLAAEAQLKEVQRLNSVEQGQNTETSTHAISVNKAEAPAKPAGPNLINGRAVLNSVLTEYEQYAPKIKAMEREVTVIQVQAAPNASEMAKMRVEASAVSARQKDKTFSRLGYKINNIILPHDISPKEFGKVIEQANNNPKVSGVIVQMPVESRYYEAVQNIASKNDIDALTKNTKQTTCATADGICRLAAPYLKPDWSTPDL